MEFYRIEHPTIMSGLVVRYREIGATAGRGFEISASRQAVMFHGESLNGILSESDLADMEEVTRRAYEQHEHLKGEQFGERRQSLPFAGDPLPVIELRKSHFGEDDETVELRPRTGKHAT